MYEFLSVSASSYDPAGLAAKLTEVSAQGWEVVSIVQTGGDVTAFVKRVSGSITPSDDQATDSSGGSNATPAVAEAFVADEVVKEEAEEAEEAAEAAVADVVADDDDANWILGADDAPEMEVAALTDVAGSIDTSSIDMPAVDMPAIDMPAIDIEVPEIDTPDISLPSVDLGSVDMPAVDVGSIDVGSIDVPEIDVPEIDVPEIDMPAVEMPSVAMPEIDIPSVEAVSEPSGWAVSPEAEVPSYSYDNTSNETTVDTPAVAEPTTMTPVVEPVSYAYEPEPAPVASVPAGWYADPAGRFELRYWDGLTWTEHVARAGQQYTDPPVA